MNLGRKTFNLCIGAASIALISSCLARPVSPRIESKHSETHDSGDAGASDEKQTSEGSKTTADSTSSMSQDSTSQGSTTSMSQDAMSSMNGTDTSTSACMNGQKLSFNNYPAQWEIENTGRIKDALPNEKVITDPEKGPVLQVKYGKGTSSPSASRDRGLAPGGTQFVPRITGTYSEATLSYWLKIPANFDCVKGGKLPGIASNIDLISGGETADGHNGFSVRLMWRENCTGEVYAYLPRDENKLLTDKYKDTLTQNSTTKIIYGWSIGRGEFSFPKGQWTRIDLTVHTNTVGKADGSVQVALDGKQVFERKEIVYRTIDSLKIGALFFSTFFGGSDETYAASKDEYLYFGDMTLCPIKNP